MRDPGDLLDELNANSRVVRALAQEIAEGRYKPEPHEIPAALSALAAEVTRIGLIAMMVSELVIGRRMQKRGRVKRRKK